MADKSGLKPLKPEKNSTAWWQPAMIMFFRLSAWIAVPIITALFLGKWLDHKFGTAPWLFLITTGLAFAVSIYGLVKNASKEIGKLNGKDKNTEQKDVEKN